MQELEAQKQDAQDRLDEMDQQKAKLRDMLSDVRQKCQDETQMVSLTPSSAGGLPAGFFELMKPLKHKAETSSCFNRVAGHTTRESDQAFVA